jgi:hypothetical protein
MEAMTDEEFEAYLAEEQAKYDRMIWSPKVPDSELSLTA